MGKALVIDNTVIDITDGTIKINGEKVGTVFNELKHGYHPAIKLIVNKKVEWHEMDTKDLIDVIFARAVAIFNGADVILS